jgi:tripartite-type tricarboxylate transporter receptor subunit TctC
MNTIRLLAVLAFSFGSAIAGAQGTYPTRPIKLMVPYPAGGGADLLARAVSQKLGDALGQPIVVENRPGANGIIGTDAVAKAPADGYTLLLGNIGPNAINQALYPKLPYDCVKDFAPIGQMATTAHILAVHPSLPATNVQELIALAKASPGKLSYASTGIGGSPHLAAELFDMLTGTRMNHVPYKGASPANADLIGGQVQLSFNTLPPLLAQVKAGRVRALAVTSARRAGTMPGLPTIAESGVPGYDVSTWYGLLAPAGTPREVVLRLNAELNKLLQAPEMKAQMGGKGFDVETGTPEQFGNLIAAEVVKWTRVAKAANVKVDE